MGDAGLFEASLEAVAEAMGDPAPAVYARLFAERPDLQALFILGPNAKGHMLDEALKVLADIAAGEGYGRLFLQSEVVNHVDVGVDAATFGTFYETVRATFADALGQGWRAEWDDAWRRLIVEANALLT